MEHHSHFLAEMEKFPAGLSNDEQMKFIKTIAEEMKSHMARFVAMRCN